MQTITIDVVNEKAMQLLLDLEVLQLIHVHKKELQETKPTHWALRHKGAMTKQSPDEIDNQLNELRNGWE